MEFSLIRDESSQGKWLVIIGCPLPERHSLKDSNQKVSGPSFAQCAHCDYQVGKNYETLNADGTYDGADTYPERLRCGYENTEG